MKYTELNWKRLIVKISKWTKYTAKFNSEVVLDVCFNVDIRSSNVKNKGEKKMGKKKKGFNL